MPYPDPERLKMLLERFAGQRALVLGDLMLDCYVWGDTARISPEAPVPVIDAREETLRLGGAANVAHNIQALGADAMLVGLTGADARAQDLFKILREKRISAGWLVADRSRITTTKTRILARNQQVVRVDREDTHEVGEEILDAILDRCMAAMEKATICVISDYGKGLITRALLSSMLAEARRRGLPVCVDPKETHFFAYREVAVITPNQLEAGAAYGRRIRDLQTLLAAGRYLREELDAEAVLITRGDQGMTLFGREGPPQHLPTVAKDVFDVTGAGDTVVSAYAVALAAGAAPPEAAAIANHAAGVVIREVGTAAADREALLRSFAENDGGESPQPLQADPAESRPLPDPAGLSGTRPGDAVAEPRPGR